MTHPLLNESIPNQLDLFLLDTFQPHTRHDRVITFPDVMACYKQWCEAMQIPPLANHIHIGSALRKRFFYLTRDNKRYWFIEIKPDIITPEEIEF